jgi:hypothetical protein
MLRLALPLALLLLAPEAARADECDGLAQQIAGATGGKVGRRSGPSIDIRIPGSIKLDLTCRAEPIVQASSGDPTPSPVFFRDLSIASQLLVGESAGTVQSVLGKAYQTALAERRKSFIQQNGWSASCYTDTAGAIRTLCSVGRIPPG